MTKNITVAEVNSVIRESHLETLAVCPLCSSDATRDVCSVQVAEGCVYFVTAVCLKCSLIYRRVRPMLMWFEKNWAYRSRVEIASGITSMIPHAENLRYRRYGECSDQLQLHGYSGRIVDVGCGPPSGLNAFRDKGWDVTGVEPDSLRAQSVPSEGITIIETTVEDYVKTNPEPFDVATCQHALEHFHHPQTILWNVSRLVRPGGGVYVEVPDFEQHVINWHDALYITHLTNFTLGTLTSCGRSVGLEPLAYIFPKADSFGSPADTHLGCLFKRNNLHYRLSTSAVGLDEYADRVQGIYSRGLTPSPNGRLRFEVPIINDLGFSWRPTPRIATSDDKTTDIVRLDRKCEYRESDDVYVVTGAEETARIESWQIDKVKEAVA